jgi:hypothetical protein
VPCVDLWWSLTREHDGPTQEDVGKSITSPQKMALLRVEVVGKRFHRITVEWTLNDWPSAVWIEAFKDAVGDVGDVHLHVPALRATDGDDKTIVWAMFEADVLAAASFVGRAVVCADAQCDVRPNQPLTR